MKNQRDKSDSSKSDIEQKWDDDAEEITVRKHISDLDETPEELEKSQEVEDYKLMYEELLEELKREKEENLRKLAEVENFRKRLLKEKEEVVKFATEELLHDIFPSLDNMEMTLQHATEEQIKKDPVISGVNLVLKQFVQTLQKHGVEEIAGEGEKFNPNEQEAIETRKSDDHESGTVIQVQRKGYKLHGRVLRAAMVTVAE